MGSALAMGLAAMIVLGIVSIFSKSEGNKQLDILKNPNDVDGNLVAGIKLFNDDKFDEALAHFHNINRKINPQTTSLADIYIGRIHFNRSEFEEAKNLFLTVIENKSILMEEHGDGIAFTYFLLGYINFHEGKYSNAKQFKKIAINMNSDFLKFTFPPYEEYIEI